MLNFLTGSDDKFENQKMLVANKFLQPDVNLYLQNVVSDGTRMIKSIKPQDQSIAVKSLKTSVKGIKKIGGIALGLANYVIGSETIDQELEQIESTINDQNAVKSPLDQEFKENFLMFQNDQEFIGKFLEKSTELEQ